MKNISLFILCICFPVNLTAQTPITFNELFDYAVTINYADIPKAIEINLHATDIPPVTGVNYLLGTSDKDYHAKVFKIDLAEGEKLRVYSDPYLETYFFRKYNNTYVPANVREFQTSVQIENTGEVYIVVMGEYGQDFEKTTLTLDLPHHFYTVAELYEQATDLPDLSLVESGTLEENNSFIVGDGIDEIGYSGISFLARSYKFSIDTDKSVLLSYSNKNSSSGRVYIFAENAGQFNLIEHYYTGGISKKLIAQPGNYLVVAMEYCFYQPYSGFIYNYTFEAESTKPSVSLEDCAEDAEKIETLPYSLTCPPGNGLHSHYIEDHYEKAFKVRIEAGKAIRADFNSEGTNARFRIHYRSGDNNLIYANAYRNINSLSFKSPYDGEYIIFIATDQPMETIGFTLNITETPAPGGINELYESAVQVSNDDMPFSLNSTLGAPPSKFVAGNDNIWLNAQTFKVTMKAKENIRMNVTGADIKVYQKENDAYEQTYDYSGNVLYAREDGEYYIVVSSESKNGNVDFSLKIDRITGLRSLEDILSEAKPLNTTSPCNIQGVLNEQSSIVDRDYHSCYATAYRLRLKAGTAARIKASYEHYATVAVYQKIDGQYQLISSTYHNFPMTISAEESDYYYILVSSNRLSNSAYDLNITETASPISYQELINATQHTTTLPFIGSGTLNNEHASLLNSGHGSYYNYFSNAYKVHLEAGTVLEYKLTSDFGKSLYIFDSQTYDHVYGDDAHGSYLVPQSGNYHIIVSANEPLEEEDYTIKLRTFTTIPIETLLENAPAISSPDSFTDVLGGDSEPCVRGNDYTSGYYFAKAYKLHLNQDEQIYIEAASDFLYPGISLARKNLRGEFVTLVTGTESLRYRAKETGDYYLTISSIYQTYHGFLTSGDFTLTIQPFTYSTLNNLLDNAGELFFKEDRTCFVTDRMETDPIQRKTQYDDNYYDFVQAYKIHLEAGTHLLAYTQADYTPSIELYKKNGAGYQRVTGSDNPKFSFIDETGDYYVVVSVSEYNKNYRNNDFTLFLKAFVPVTLDDLCANAAELNFPGSITASFEMGNSSYLFSDGYYYRFAQAYVMNLTTETNIMANISEGSFKIYVKKENTFEPVNDYYSSWDMRNLKAGEYYFIVYGSVTLEDTHPILKVDRYTEDSSLDELFKNAQIIDGQKDLPYAHFCDFTQSSVPVVQSPIGPMTTRTSKVKAFRLKNFSSEQYQIEFASNIRRDCELYLYEKDGSEYVLMDHKKNIDADYLNSTLMPSSGKEYMILIDVNLFGTSKDIYMLNITDSDTPIPASKILDMKLEGGHHIRIPSTATVEDIKELLSNKKIIPKVGHGAITPVVRNSVSNWTVNQALTQATGTFEAPEGYQFADGAGTIVVEFNNPSSKVSGIKMVTKNATVGINESTQLTATVAPSDAAEKSVIWEVSNPQIAHIDVFTGLVTGITPGITVVKAKSLENDLYYDLCILTVEGIPVSNISLDKTAATININESEQLVAIITPDNAYYTDLIWSSSDPSVAEVDKSGQVTGISEGTAIISVTTDDGRHSATCEVTVAGATTGADIPETQLLSVYPNPARDIVRISGLEGGEILYIMDMTGKRISTRQAGSETEIMNVGHLPQGMYLLCVMKGDTKKVIKLIVVD